MWSARDIDDLKTYARKYADRDKSDRWRKVGQKLNRTKRECYEKYKELKREREANGSSISRPTSSSQQTSSRPNSSSQQSSSKYSEDHHHQAQAESKLSTEFESKTTTDIKKTSSPYNPPKKSSGGGLNFFDDDDDEDPDADSDDGGFRIDYNAGSKKKDTAASSSSSSSKRRVVVCSERDPNVLNSASRCTSTSIEITAAADIRKLLFGGRRMDCFNKAWTEQGFFFNTMNGLKCGLLQNKGGPCGVIAAVQAHVMKHLLFSTDLNFKASSYQQWSNPTQKQQEQALLDALTEIVWRIAEHSNDERKRKQAIVAIPSRNNRNQGRTSGYKPDGITETLSLYTLNSKESTRDFLDAHLNTFMIPNGLGAVLFTYSCILTRGLNNVRKDMDKMIDVPSLIGRHDYAAQELVNLMLCGLAHSNVFDGTQDMGGLLLRGIPSQTNIGMLTLFEHYGHVRVGKNMKLPIYPIWVLCSESHYSVLFSSNQNEVNDPCLRKGGHKVDLYYYDELAKQEEMYRLTVEMPEYNKTSDEEENEHSKNESDLTPPIDHVIRTHWKAATVDWNGSEALL